MDLALRWGQDDLVRFLIDPSHVFENEAEPSSIEDPEGYHYQAFEKAYEDFDNFKQIFHLEKMADLFLLKRNYAQVVHLLNAAYVLAKESEYSVQTLIQAKLGRIEGLFLYDELGIKSSPDHWGHVMKHRSWLEEIRKMAQLCLDKTFSIKSIQKDLTSEYKNLLTFIISDSIKLLGKAPIFAAFCLGSMAREEMCPYSDVEFGFFLKEVTPENNDYFRRLTRLIELKIMNLGETKFPIVRPKRMGGIVLEGGSIAPSGFSMDIGELSPLGRAGVFELIGTPEELAVFQTEEWLSKQDAEIILVNAMTRPGFLMGDPKLLKDYEAHLDEILDSKIGSLELAQTLRGKRRPKVRQKRALELMKGYVTEFTPRLDEDKIALRGFDVKRELYRLPHSLINALALYYGIRQHNTLEQLEALTERKVFTPRGEFSTQKAPRSSHFLEISNPPLLSK